MNRKPDRRTYLKELAAIGSLTAIAGCNNNNRNDATETDTPKDNSSGDDETSTESKAFTPDLDTRPFKYVLSPEVLSEKGYIDLEGVGSLTVPYMDPESIREDLSDEARDAISPISSPPEMLVIKYGSTEIDKSDVNLNEVNRYVHGPGMECLIETSLDSNELEKYLRDHDFTQTGEKDGWKLFDGEFEYVLSNITIDGTAPMRTAVKDGYVALARKVPEDGVSYYGIEPTDLDGVFNTYLTMLTEDPSLSLSEADKESSKHARTAEEILNGEYDGREQDAVFYQKYFEEEPFENREDTERPQPVDARIEGHDFHGRKQTETEYIIFDDGHIKTKREDPVDIIESNS